MITTAQPSVISSAATTHSVVKQLTLHTLTLCALVSLTAIANAQNYFSRGLNTSTKSFMQIKREADSLYAISSAANGGVATKEEKNYRRWENDVMSRCLYPTAPVGGSVLGAKAYVRNNFYTTTTGGITTASVANTLCATGPAESVWRNIGENPIVDSTLQKIGIIISVAVHPTNNNIIYAGTGSSGIFKTIDGGLNWVNITDGLGITGLGVKSIAINPKNPNILLAGTGTTSYGASLQFDSPYSFIEGIGVIKSTDGGLTWVTTSIASSPDFHYNIEAIRYNPVDTNIAYAVGDRYIYKSTNSGTNWSIVYNNTTNATQHVHFSDLEISLANTSTIYASTYANDSINVAQFYVSNNAGASWTKAPLGFSGLNGLVMAIDVTPAEPNAVYALQVAYTITKIGTAKYVYEKHFVFKSIDNGVHWRLLNSTVPTRYFDPTSTNNFNFGYWKHEFEVSNKDTVTMYMGGDNFVKTTNRGGTWVVPSSYTYTPTTPASTSTHADIRAFFQLPTLAGQDVLYMGDDGGIAKTTNSAISFKNLNGNGLSIGEAYSVGVFANSDNITVGLQDNGTKLKDSKTSPWKNVVGGDGGWTDVNSTYDSITYAQSNRAKLISRNGGKTFSTMWTDSNWLFYANDNCPDPNNSNIIWNSKATKKKYTYNITNNIITLKDTSINPMRIEAFEVARANSNVIYASHWSPTWGAYPNPYTLERSMDGGATWTDLSFNPGGIKGVCIYSVITDLETDPTDANIVFASAAGYDKNGQYRVLMSTNAGASWADISNGLTGMPVNQLVYQKNGYLYAATDAGVYYYKNGTWQCFNNGLPPTIVRKIRINPCQNTITAATYGRGIWQATLANTPAIHLNANTTVPLGTSIVYNNDVIVDSAITYTVKGTVAFAKDKLLIVKRGAKLVVDGGTLTNSCNNLWAGVQLQGTGTQPQTIAANGLCPYQAMAQLINGATVQNANDALTFGVTDAVGNIDYNSFGGICYATNAKFVNNKRDVQLLSYPNYNNKTYFDLCTFEVNRTLNTAVNPTNRVTMWNVKNINFRGCVVKNTSAYPSNAKGRGLYSIDAQYTITDYVGATTTPSSINNWDYGIVSENTNPLMVATITNVQFANNGFGAAKLKGINYPVFNGCTVDVGGEFHSWGLYLEACKYYKIQNNTFSTTHAGYTGIYALNSGAGVHQIYRNTFNNLTAGITPLDDNSGTTNTTDGLKINCNVFTANQYDIAVMPSLTGNATSIATTQGSIIGSSNNFSLVRNAYSATCGNESKFYVDGSSKQIVHGSYTGASYSPLPQPSCSDLVVNVQTKVATYSAQDCPNALGPPCTTCKVNPNAPLLAAKQELKTLQANYNAVLDGGSTTTLTTTVQQSTNANSLSTTLSAKGLLLTDSVLLAYITKSPTPPAGHIKAVAVANSPLSPTVLAAVQQLNLPKGIQQQIDSAQTGLSLRDGALAQINLAAHEVQSLVSLKISNYLRDTLNTALAIDSVIATITTEGRSATATEAIQAHLHKGNYALANQLLTTQELKQGVNDACTLLRAQTQWQQRPQGAKILVQDKTMLAKLTAIATNYSHPMYAQAQTMLTLAQGANYATLTRLPSVSVGSTHRVANTVANIDSLTTQTTINVASGEKLLFTTYPNPAKSEVNFSLQGTNDCNYTLVITNIYGLVIDRLSLTENSTTHYATQHLINGLYFVKLYCNGAVISEQKLIVLK